jgi:Beta-propeller repeat
MHKLGAACVFALAVLIALLQASGLSTGRQPKLVHNDPRVAAISPRKSVSATQIAPPASLSVAAARSLLIARSLAFEPNHGQTDARVRYLAHTDDFAVFLTESDAVLRLSPPLAKINAKNRSKHPARKQAFGVLRLRPIDANLRTAMSGEDRMRARVNYFIGGDPSRWHTDIPTFAKVNVHELWPGIDQTWYGTDGRLESDFVLKPGANPSTIKLALEGAQNARVDRAGNLIVRAGGREVRLIKPEVYQTLNGIRRTVSGGYLVSRAQSGKYQVAFRVSNYDRTQPLVIDPIINYLTYFGGSGQLSTDTYNSNTAGGIATDASGNLYVVGSTNSVDLPVTAGSYSPELPSNGSFFVSEINPTAPAASQLIYSTYFPGETELARNEPPSIALDKTNGRIYFVANAVGAFPVTAGAFSRNCVTSAGCIGTPALAVLDPSLSGANQLVYASFFGGDIKAIAVNDANGQAYLTGSASTGLPTTTSALIQTCPNGCEDAADEKHSAAFLSVIDPSQSGSAGLVYSTYLAGDELGDGEVGWGLAVDSAGKAYVTGAANDNNYPVTSNAYDSTCPGPSGTGCQSTFISVIDPTKSGTSSLFYSTYLGGTDEDLGTGIALDSNDHIYVAGLAESTNFPTTMGAYQTSCPGGTAGNCGFFVSKFDITQSTPANQLVYSTYVGGTMSAPAAGRGPLVSIAVDSNDNAIVGGPTEFLDFPTPDGLQTTCAGGCAQPSEVVFELNSSGTEINYGSFVTGSNGTLGAGLATGANGYIYVSGTTGSSDLPVSSNALEPTCVACPGGGGTGETGFVTVLNPAATGTASLIYSSYEGGSGRPKRAGLAEVADALAVDSAGGGYITGTTNSVDFPTKNTPSGLSSCPGSGCMGASYVAKFDPTQTVAANSLIYSTYYGGSAETEAQSIALDSSKDAYISGVTEATTGTLPLVNAYQSTCPTCANVEPSQPQGTDGFVAELNPAGDSLLYSTYFGSMAGASSPTHGNETTARGIAVDSSGNIFISGETTATDIPTTTSAYSATCPLEAVNGDCDAGFLAELNPGADNQLVYSTYFSGTTNTTLATDNDTAPATEAGSVAVDSHGKAYIEGSSTESDLPTTAESLNPGPCVAQQCAFLAKFDTTMSGASSLIYSTILNGTTGLSEGGEGSVTADSSGDAYATGATFASDFPTKNPYQGTCGDCANSRGMAFVVELNPAGSALLYSTFLGGTSDLFLGAPATGSGGFNIGLTPSGNILVGGITISPDFPVTAGAVGVCGGAFITELNPAAAPANQLIYSTCIGNLADIPLIGTATTVASDSTGTKIYFAGATVDNSLPVTSNAYQSTCKECVNFQATALFGVLIPPASSPVPTATPTITQTPGPTATATRSATATATATATRSATATATTTGTRSATATATATATRSATPTSTVTATRSSTPTATATATSSRTPTATATATRSATPTGTTTSTATHTPTATRTSTPTASATGTRTATPTASATRTAAPTLTATATSTVAPSRTATATPTIAVTPTISATPTPTPGGEVILIDKGIGGGNGTTDDLGEFGYTPSDNAEQIVSSATVTLSKPKLFSSLTLTASLDGEQIGTSTIDAPEITSTTVFTFSPPLTIPPGGGESITFALTGVIAGKQAAGLSLSNQVKLAGIIGVGNHDGGGLGATGNLMFGLSLLGLAMFPVGIRTRRRTSILAAAMLVLAVGLAGCSGGSSGSSGPPPSESSTQKLIALDVTENGNPVTVSGLPIDLGKITKK